MLQVFSSISDDNEELTKCRGGAGHKVSIIIHETVITVVRQKPEERNNNDGVMQLMRLSVRKPLSFYRCLRDGNDVQYYIITFILPIIYDE